MTGYRVSSVLTVLASLFKSKIRLEAEKFRHQVIVLRRKLRGGVR
jgi:hypothetical protein